MAAEIQVASIIAPVSMPVVPRMEGLTKMMYAIVKKVVRPATISVRTVVLFSFNLKKSFRDTVDSFALGSHSSNVFLPYSTGWPTAGEFAEHESQGRPAKEGNRYFYYIDSVHVNQ